MNMGQDNLQLREWSYHHHILSDGNHRQGLEKFLA